MQPPPAGLWGLPPEILATLPGYGPDIEKNRAQARELMEKHGYGPNNRLAVKVSTRNIAQYRDPAVILIDQMKQIYIDGELEVVETANWFPKIARKDYMVAAEPDRQRGRRPRRVFLRALRLRFGAELHELLQCRPGEAVRPAIRGSRSGQAQEAGLGYRQAADQDDGARPIVYAYDPRHLSLSAGARHHDDGQQHLQWLALRGCLARPMTAQPARVLA